MQRHVHVAARLDAHPARGFARPRALEVRHQRVDHHVADLADAPVGDAFPAQVLVRVRARREQQVGERVRDEPVDLLGHAAVERAQPGLHVRGPHADLGRDEGRGHRRVDVAHHHQPVGAVGLDHGLEAQHDLGGLRGVALRAHLQVLVGRCDPELVEEHLRHRFVVMLPGVDEALLEAAPARGHAAHDRRHLHEVRPGPHDVQDLHDAFVYQRGLLERGMIIGRRSTCPEPRPRGPRDSGRRDACGRSAPRRTAARGRRVSRAARDRPRAA